MTTQPKSRISARSRALSLLCILLTLFVAAAQVNHVHPGSSTSPDRDCSICSVAHSTALVAVAALPVPIFFPTVLVSSLKPSLRSFLTVSFLYIRPPPSV